MKRSSRLRFLAPHAVSVACFFAAFAWLFAVGANNTLPDLYLAIAGFVALAAALIASITACVILIWSGEGRYWLWLLAHLGALVLALALASIWIGAHLA